MDVRGNQEIERGPLDHWDLAQQADPALMDTFGSDHTAPVSGAGASKPRAWSVQAVVGPEVAGRIVARRAAGARLSEFTERWRVTLAEVGRYCVRGGLRRRSRSRSWCLGRWASGCRPRSVMPGEPPGERAMSDMWLSGRSLVVQVPVRLVGSPIGAAAGGGGSPVRGRGCVGGGRLRRGGVRVRVGGWPGWVGVVKLAGPVLLPCRAGAGPALQSSPGLRLGVGEARVWAGRRGVPVRRRFNRPGRCRTGDSECGA